MRCAVCHRPLTNPVSIKHGLGPDCLRRAALAGTAPLEALGELATWQRSRPKRERCPSARPAVSHDTHTRDIFEDMRRKAIEALNAAAIECRSLGIKIELNIEENAK